MDADDFGTFLCKVFDDWQSAQTWAGTLSICSSRGRRCGWGVRPRFAPSTTSAAKPCCWKRDGNLYSCDHFVYPEFRLGNIREKPLVETVFSGRQVRFGLAKQDALPEYCRDCEYLFACWGECPRRTACCGRPRASRA